MASGRWQCACLPVAHIRYLTGRMSAGGTALTESDITNSCLLKGPRVVRVMVQNGKATCSRQIGSAVDGSRRGLAFADKSHPHTPWMCDVRHWIETTATRVL